MSLFRIETHIPPVLGIIYLKRMCVRFNITWHNVFSFTINRMNFFGSIRKFMTHINNAVLINPNVFFQPLFYIWI